MLRRIIDARFKWKRLLRTLGRALLGRGSSSEWIGHQRGRAWRGELRPTRRHWHDGLSKRLMRALLRRAAGKFR